MSLGVFRKRNSQRMNNFHQGTVEDGREYTLPSAIPEQHAEAFLLEVTVVCQNIADAFAAHRLHGNAVCQAVAFIESRSIEF